MGKYEYFVKPFGVNFLRRSLFVIGGRLF